MTPAVAAHGQATGVERVFREVYGQAVATLVRVFGDITLAEDAVQEAFVVASDRWQSDGIPPNPAGWIVTTARNRAIDHLRRTARLAAGRLFLSELDRLAASKKDFAFETTLSGLACASRPRSIASCAASTASRSACSLSR